MQGEIKRIFTGWMFAASPGLHAVEHPIYDVWLTDCAAPASGPGGAIGTAARRRRRAAQCATGRAPARRDAPTAVACGTAGGGAGAPTGHRRLTRSAFFEVFERGGPGNRAIERQRGEIGFADQRGVEQLMIGRPRHFDGAEGSQMIGDELGVEQAIVPGLSRATRCTSATLEASRAR